MAIIPLTPDFFENFSVEANPRRAYSSSSDGTIIGSVPVFGRISPVEKSNYRDSPFQLTTFDEGGFEEWRDQWVKNCQSFTVSGSTTALSSSNNFSSALVYLEKVNAQTLDAGRNKKLHVIRFEPSFRLTSDTLRKNIIRKVVYPYYRIRYPSLNWAFTNYNTLNFFTGSELPNDSAMIYPAPSSSLTGETQYRPTGPFTLDFYVNPRYTVEERDAEYHAGTIMHMSSSFAVSLVSGSDMNRRGHSSGFRLLLQLSHSADIAPSQVDLTKIDDGTYASPGTDTFNYNDLMFLSTNNSLNLNQWHHVAVRWGTNTVNQGTGSIMIDGVEDSTFVIPSGSIIPQSFGDPQGDPDALFVGNFYEGQNKSEFAMGVIGKKITIPEANLMGNLMLTPPGTMTINDGTSNRVIDFAYGVTNDNDITVMGAPGAPAYETRFVDAINGSFGGSVNVTAVAGAGGDDAVINLTHDAGGTITITFQQNGADNIATDFMTVSNIMGPTGGPSIQNLVAQFFNSNAAYTEGVTDITNGSFNIDPPVYSLRHPLNAELHDLKIYDSYRNTDQIFSSSIEGPESLEPDLLFYVPPFFVKESRERDILQTPFQAMRSKTDDPFNVALSFGVGGHLLNLENFTRELVKGEYPRLLHLTASTIDSTTEWATANQFLFATGSIRKRNLSILPNDNGGFRPNFSLLRTGSLNINTSGSLEDRFVNDFGSLDLSLVTLNNLVPSASILPGLIAPDAGARGTQGVGTGSIISAIEGAGPENLGVAPGSVLTILQRTRDTSSNEVVFFDTSNLFYGTQIQGKTFVLNDPGVTGSSGRVSMTFRDDGRGNLYRADCTGSHATWSSVGNIIYEEGLANVLTPTIPYFGKESFNVQMRGKQNIHVLEVMVPCSTENVNSSSNPAYKRLKPSDYSSDNNSSFVYITGLNLHDNNLNIIAKATLAQPIVKADSDEFMFRVKLDF